jgi:NADH:ubiquinone oxidoreductase subunit F (NADH-binding)/NADH:ubiquinone oxidoreductase subunit E
VLIDDLRAIQERCGYLPEAELQEYAGRCSVPLYQIQAVASFYPFFRREPPPRVELRVCADLSCHLRGAGDLLRRAAELGQRSGGEIDVSACSCIGLCDRAPALLRNDHPLDAAQIGADLDALVLPGWQPAPSSSPGLSFSADVYGPGERYRLLHALRDGLAVDELIDRLKESGLRGMGGAGFPAGTKWELVRGAAGTPKYVICNADESEPGTFKDRALLEHAPHLVLEGMLAAAIAVDAAEAIIYVRHEYEAPRAAFEHEMDRARAAGLLDGCPPVRVFVSPGGYICGEETALLEALEGKRAEPRNKPPFPGTHGLFGRPTLINNVETFALVPGIALRGSEWYRSVGMNGGAGPKLLALSGDVERPGVYEVPLGLPIAAFIEQFGGGVSDGRQLKAVMPGGPSSGFLPASMADTPLEFRALAQVGSMLGSGAVIVLDERRCMLDCALNVVRFFRNESCGKCVPCRAGSQQLVEILARWRAGEGREDDVALVEELAAAMADASICGLGQIAPAPALSALKYWPDEVLAHLREGRCPAGVCREELLAGD